MALKVIQPGVYATVQDLGRFGHQSEGFSQAGAMDYRSFMLANQLLGNDSNAPGIEMTLQGASFGVLKDTVIAAAGADMALEVGGRTCPVGVPVHVAKGETIQFGQAMEGARTYLAVAGGFDIPEVLGSAATHPRSGIGGFKGRPLQAGDILEVKGGSVDSRPVRARRAETDDTVHIIPGQQYGRFSDDAKETFFSSEYELSSQCDRMGFRMEGPEIKTDEGHDVLSEPTQLGSIQISKDGKPIVLLNDRQTAGGYVRIATVALSDIPKFVQKRPGDAVIFKEISVEEATERYRQEMEKIHGGDWLEVDPRFSHHRRPVANRIERIMER